MPRPARKKDAELLEAHSDSRGFMVDREVTIQNVAEIYAELSSAFQSSQELVIELGDAGESDLTFVQLIESARRTAAGGRRGLALAAPAAGALRAMLERGGFVGSPESRQFWFHEGSQ